MVRLGEFLAQLEEENKFVIKTKSKNRLILHADKLFVLIFNLLYHFPNLTLYFVTLEWAKQSSNRLLRRFAPRNDEVWYLKVEMVLYHL